MERARIHQGPFLTSAWNGMIYSPTSAVFNIKRCLPIQMQPQNTAQALTSTHTSHCLRHTNTTHPGPSTKLRPSSLRRPKSLPHPLGPNPHLPAHKKQHAPSALRLRNLHARTTTRPLPALRPPRRIPQRRIRPPAQHRRRNVHPASALRVVSAARAESA